MAEALRALAAEIDAADYAHNTVMHLFRADAHPRHDREERTALIAAEAAAHPAATLLSEDGDDAYDALCEAVGRWRSESDVNDAKVAALEAYAASLDCSDSPSTSPSHSPMQERSEEVAEGPRNNKARSRISYMCASDPPQTTASARRVPLSFTEDICTPVARLLTSAALRIAKAASGAAERPSEEGGSADDLAASSSVPSKSSNSPSSLSPTIRRLIAIYSTYLLPIAVLQQGSPPLPSSSGASGDRTKVGPIAARRWRNEDLASLVGPAGGDEPVLLCALQPLFAGVEALVKPVAFHVSGTAGRTDQTALQRSRKIFDLIAAQLPAVGAFADAFQPSAVRTRQPTGKGRKGANEREKDVKTARETTAISARAIAVGAFCVAIDGLLSSCLVAPAAADPLGVGLLGVFDALMRYAKAFAASPPPAFVTDAEGAVTARLTLPGAAAVLGWGNGEVLDRAAEAAYGRLVSLLPCDEGGDGLLGAVQATVASPAGKPLQSAGTGAAIGAEKVPWRQAHLSAAFNVPLPSHALAQSGRVVAAFTETLLATERLCHGLPPQCPSPQAVRRRARAFLARAVGRIAAHCTARLEGCFERDGAPLEQQAEEHLAIHLDASVAAEWGSEWRELFGGEGNEGWEGQGEEDALDTLSLDRDRCLRSLADLVARLAEAAGRRIRDGSCVGHECQLVGRRLAAVHRLYGASDAWVLANRAASERAARTLSAKAPTLSGADVRDLLAAIAGERAGGASAAAPDDGDEESLL